MLLITAPVCLLHLRFPIADLQPLSKRRPWWMQAIHKELLVFDLKQVQFQSDFLSEESNSLTVTSEAIQGLFCRLKRIFTDLLFSLLSLESNVRPSAYRPTLFE